MNYLNYVVQTNYSSPFPESFTAIRLSDNSFQVSGQIGDVYASPVPEPATWAMMILGFAGIGVMAFRRSRRGKELPALH